MFSIKNSKPLSLSTSTSVDSDLKDLKKFYDDKLSISTVNYPDPDDAGITLEDGQILVKNSQLYIDKAISEVMDNIGNPNLYQISIRASGTGGSTSGGICFREPNTDALCSIIGYDQGLNARMGLSFNTGDIDEIGEAMNITADKNVGIGTSDPSCKLEVNGYIRITGTENPSEVMNNPENPDLYQLSIRATGSGGSTSGGLCFKEPSTDALCSIIGYDDGGDARMGFSFNTGDKFGISEAMNIKSNQNVGIGTSSPSSKLEVNGDIRVGGVRNSTKLVNTTPYDVKTTDNVILCGNVGAPLILNLPEVNADIDGKELEIKEISNDSPNNNIEIVSNGSQPFDGRIETLTVNTEFGGYKLLAVANSSYTGWVIINS